MYVYYICGNTYLTIFEMTFLQTTYSWSFFECLDILCLLIGKFRSLIFNCYVKNKFNTLFSVCSLFSFPRFLFPIFLWVALTYFNIPCLILSVSAMQILFLHYWRSNPGVFYHGVTCPAFLILR